MYNKREETTPKTKFYKRIICLLLSLILALGTFITMTFGNLYLSDYIDFRNRITAFAGENALTPVPVFYRQGELVGIYRVNYTDDTALQYKIGEDGEWMDYSVPFAVPAHQTTKVYARIGTNGKMTYMNFSTTDKALGVYTESSTDFEFSYNNINFGYTRIYNSVDKDWFESTHSKVLAANSRLEVTLPDSTQYTMIRKDADTYVDELNGYVMTKTHSEYIFDDGQYKYHFAIVAVKNIAYLSAIEDYAGNRLNLNRTANAEEISISDGAGRVFSLSAMRAVSAPEDSSLLYCSQRDITDPNGNKIVYTTKSDRYIQVRDQAGVSLGEYGYKSAADYTLIRSADKTISYYDNGRLQQITYDNGSWIKYTYDDENMLYTTLTSSGEATKTVYNDAFLPVEYTDERGEKTEYTYDAHYRIKTEKTDGETFTYTYDTKGNILSCTTDNTENADNNACYTYDADGNVIREQNGSSYTYYTYDSNKNVLIRASLKADYSGEPPAAYDAELTCFDTVCYTYDNKGRLIEEQDAGSTTQYEYDSSGNVTKETVTVTENDSTNTTVTAYTYDDMGNVLTSQCDSDTSSYIYDNAGRTLLANENGNCTRTLYDSLGRTVQEIGPEDYDSTKEGLPQANTYSDSNVGQRYVYNETTGNLSSETNRLGVTTDYAYYETGEKKTERFDEYVYNYLRHGDLESVKIAGETTVSYTYDENYNLISENYANGDKLRYVYDDAFNLIKQYHNDDTAPFVTYTYNADNELTQKINTVTGLKYVYNGDTVSVYKTSDNTLIQSYTETVTEADEENNIEGKTDVTETHFGTSYSSVIQNNSISYTTGGNTVLYAYTEDEESGRHTADSVKYNGNTAHTSAYTYDENDNITVRHTTYKEQGYPYYIDFMFAYDTNGRILSQGLYDDYSEVYYYDENGQLRRVNSEFNDLYTRIYTYDSRGNITSKKLYEFFRDSNAVYGAPIKTLNYTYGDSSRKDLLTKVNDTALTYDEVGNVLTYGDRAYTWNSGRHLESITDGENTYSYTYDENGIRASKTVNGKTTYYNTRDGVILSQSDGTDTMYFQYDESGTPLGLIFNGEQYFYLAAQNGDIIGITDSDGRRVGGYSYDIWGKLLSEKVYNYDEHDYTNLIHSNPFRYRGYYYDTETEYYYLQSRYYDPDLCRFINADDHNYLDTDTVNGLNLFAYCGNEPVNFVDETGLKKAKKKSKYIDITYDLTVKMLDNADDFYEYAKQRIDGSLRSGVIKDNIKNLNSAVTGIIKYFIKKSKTNGDWDLKNTWSTISGKNKNKTFLYNGTKLKNDDVGNLHFGFVGYLIFPLVVLKAGAGMYQIKSRTSKFKYIFHFFDDPRDSKKIKEGYNLAKSSQVSTITAYLNKSLKDYPKYVWKIMTL